MQAYFLSASFPSQLGTWCKPCIDLGLFFLVDDFVYVHHLRQVGHTFRFQKSRSMSSHVFSYLVSFFSSPGHHPCILQVYSRVPPERRHLVGHLMRGRAGTQNSLEEPAEGSSLRPSQGPPQPSQKPRPPSSLRLGTASRNDCCSLASRKSRRPVAPPPCQ